MDLSVLLVDLQEFRNQSFEIFHNWYLYAGKRTTGGIRRAGNSRESIFDRELPKYTQIGNAVPVKLAYEIGKHFLNLI